MDAAEDIVAAVRARDAAGVKEMLERDPTLADTPTPAGSLLLLALYMGARDAARVVRAYRPELDVFEAAALGDAGRLRELLAADPAQTRAYDGLGGTALHLACHFGHREAAKVLLDAGADADAFSRYRQPQIPKNAPLHAALAGRAREVVEVLLERGADVNRVDGAGYAPLHHAALAGDAGVVRCLLEAGAGADTQDAGGRTPLALARERGHERAAAVLREHGGTA